MGKQYPFTRGHASWWGVAQQLHGYVKKCWPLSTIDPTAPGLPKWISMPRCFEISPRTSVFLAVSWNMFSSGWHLRSCDILSIDIVCFKILQMPYIYKYLLQWTATNAGLLQGGVNSFAGSPRSCQGIVWVTNGDPNENVGKHGKAASIQNYAIGSH